MRMIRLAALESPRLVSKASVPQLAATIVSLPAGRAAAVGAAGAGAACTAGEIPRHLQSLFPIPRDSSRGIAIYAALVTNRCAGPKGGPLRSAQGRLLRPAGVGPAGDKPHTRQAKR